MNNIELAYAVTVLPKCWLHGHNVFFKRNEQNEVVDAMVALNEELLLDVNGIQELGSFDLSEYRKANSLEFVWATRMGDNPNMQQLQDAFNLVKSVTGIDPRELRTKYPEPEIEFEFGAKLSASVALQFKMVGEDQRGHPEVTMVKLQHFMGGGVLNPVIEHTGDLINRMTKDMHYGSVQCSNILDKCEKVLRYLESDYGFEKEFELNIANNARVGERDAAEFRAEIFTQLKKYADDHMKLPAYNKCHLAAKRACVAIGNWDLDEAIESLKELRDLASNREVFTKMALLYSGEPRNLLDKTMIDPYLSQFVTKEPSLSK